MFNLLFDILATALYYLIWRKSERLLRRCRVGLLKPRRRHQPSPSDCPLLQLPAELILDIAETLPPDSQVFLAQSCHRFHTLLETRTTATALQTISQQPRVQRIAFLLLAARDDVDRWCCEVCAALHPAVAHDQRCSWVDGLEDMTVAPVYCWSGHNTRCHDWYCSGYRIATRLSAVKHRHVQLALKYDRKQRQERNKNDRQGGPVDAPHQKLSVCPHIGIDYDPERKWRPDPQFRRKAGYFWPYYDRRVEQRETQDGNIIMEDTYLTSCAHCPTDLARHGDAWYVYRDFGPEGSPTDLAWQIHIPCKRAYSSTIPNSRSQEPTVHHEAGSVWALAGIIGLDVALVLVQKGLGPLITVVAEHLPGDTAPGYTSPWAGCNYSAISGEDPKALRWDRLGYRHLLALATERSAESYVQRTPSTEIWDEAVPEEKIKTMSSYLENFAVLPASKLPQGAAFGVTFTTVTVHAPMHLMWLYRRLKDAGVTFVRQKLPDLASAFTRDIASTRVVFNCIGNAAKTFPGVADATCYPTRGQVLLVKAPNVTKNWMRYRQNQLTYVIPRPLSNGNVILGGYYQTGVGDYATYGHETESILARTKELCPELRESEPEILAVAAGLRPSREGGARVEREEVVVDGKSRVVVHNYGAGGTGYQAGYGMALDAVKCVEDLLPTTTFVSRL
ncbi:NAD(P)-binding domain protein [Niveomyces insectorum RCEF 264]|uniref:NAD(P)-binding domain protein n=1 Tax=Niveomyces insectorum RCEF 264 TaxID=1081102 RepID=A0A167QGM4_9HYPO|nr:NAD(P)-binding domain protein [Niveomyces insectorum RCEF 264]